MWAKVLHVILSGLTTQSHSYPLSSTPVSFSPKPFILPPLTYPNIFFYCPKRNKAFELMEEICLLYFKHHLFF